MVPTGDGSGARGVAMTRKNTLVGKALFTLGVTIAIVGSAQRAEAQAPCHIQVFTRAAFGVSTFAHDVLKVYKSDGSLTWLDLQSPVGGLGSLGGLTHNLENGADPLHDTTWTHDNVVADAACDAC